MHNPYNELANHERPYILMPEDPGAYKFALVKKVSNGKFKHRNEVLFDTEKEATAEMIREFAAFTNAHTERFHGTLDCVAGRATIKSRLADISFSIVRVTPLWEKK